MKNIKFLIVAIIVLCQVCGVKAILPYLQPQCGSTCGQAELGYNYGTNKVYTWAPADAPPVPSTVDWSGTLYFKVINHSTGVVVLHHFKTINLLNVAVTPVAGGGKQSVLDIASAIYPVATNGVFNIAPGQYDLIYYLYVKLENLPYSSGYKYIGSNSVPLTIDANGSTFPKTVNASHVQNSNTPTTLTADGYELNPSISTSMYTCKSSWPFRMDFGTITQCRTYTVKIDYADVTVGGCGSSPAYTPGLTYNMNAVYVGGLMQNYVEYPNFNLLAGNIINSSNLGKTYKLKITISNTGPIYCSAVTVYRCITVAGPGLAGNLNYKIAGPPASWGAPVTNVALAPTLGYISLRFNTFVNPNNALTKYKVKLEASTSTGGPWINIYGTTDIAWPNFVEVLVPMSGQIPDFSPNDIDFPAPANAAFASYPGKTFSNPTTWPLWWGVFNGFPYYRLTTVVFNDCNPLGVTPQFTYFKLNTSAPLAKADEEYKDLTLEVLEKLNEISTPGFNVENKLLENSDNFIYFPNPFKDFINLSGLNIEDEIIIYDVNGKIMEKLVAKSQNHTFNTETWINSIYFYQVKDKSGKIVSGKMIKLE